MHSPSPSFQWSGHGIKPLHYIRFFGIQRSGNHAVIDGILRNAPNGNSVFLNNCGAYKKPFRNFGRLVVNGDLFEREDVETKGLKQLLAPAAPTPLLAFSYENLAPLPQDNVSGNFPDHAFHNNIIILRSFSNWLASTIRHARWIETVLQQNALDVSIRLLKFVHLHRMLLESARAIKTDPKYKIIIYDQWFASDAYRYKVLGDLGMAKRDTSLGAVQRYGQGSSFDKFSLPAEEMKTGERWQYLVGNKKEAPLIALIMADTSLLTAISYFFPEDINHLHIIKESVSAI